MRINDAWHDSFACQIDFGVVRRHSSASGYRLDTIAFDQHSGVFYNGALVVHRDNPRISQRYCSVGNGVCNLHAQVIASGRCSVVTVHQCINICCFKFGANRPANRLAVWRPSDIGGTYLACATHGEGGLRGIEIDTLAEL